ncbi:putative short chain dehydrogenase/ reductase [Annulohypoxylon truncatum]|uniref:putative short chain dehydrogenase/ reductase n=1 Tax=Annulohypoxylon truncatum TaxID=327061 RepID=UPI002008859D|nr:putative short chain dehydrogenase/ reductase [Annulohypoxylon truncatum]KAI1209351.1 putative short chain dehydrogenase/ reductase [Annulohypoxylon truncatum]
MGAPKTLKGKTVFVTGGSGGLGKAISKELAARGAHITIFARREGPLEEAKKDILTARLSEDQEINAVSLDLADASKVDEAFRAQPRIADVLYCSAGGNHSENGFLADIEAKDLDNCMKNNYYSSAYAAKSLIDMWLADDKKGSPQGAQPRFRQIIFINSAAAFLGIPGSIAYTPAKCAVRALADTLRMEVLRYNCPASTYTIHCAFPADFVSPGFVLEQKTKTPLTKRIQGLDRPFEELETRFPSSEKVATLIIAAVERGEFIICEDSFAASALFTNMTGPSPKRGLGIVDSIMGLLVGWVVWPVLRRRWESMCRQDGEESRKQVE